MSFLPAIPVTGIAGWRFLERTYDSQLAQFAADPAENRLTTYFRDTIAEVTSAEALVKDRRLREVALGAFGLGEDINNIFLVRRVLEDGTSSRDALANRLSDNRYSALSDAFGFGPLAVTQTGSPGFADRILDQYRAQSFEEAVGEQDDSLRIALYAERSLGTLEPREDATTEWFDILGEPPLRALFETALGLPSAVSQIDIDKQADIFASKSRDRFGVDRPTDFADADLRDQLIVQYLGRSQIAAATDAASPARIALTLLSGL